MKCEQCQYFYEHLDGVAGDKSRCLLGNWHHQTDSDWEECQEFEFDFSKVVTYRAEIFITTGAGEDLTWNIVHDIDPLPDGFFESAIVNWSARLPDGTEPVVEDFIEYLRSKCPEYLFFKYL